MLVAYADVGELGVEDVGPVARGVHPLLHRGGGGGVAGRDVLAPGVGPLLGSGLVHGGEAGGAVGAVMGEEGDDLRGPDLGRLGEAVVGAQRREALLGPLHVHQPHHLRRQLLRGAGILGRRLGVGLLGIGLLGIGLLGVGLLGVWLLGVRLLGVRGLGVGGLCAADGVVHAAQDCGRLGPVHGGCSVKAAIAAVEDAQGVCAGDGVPVSGGHAGPVPDGGLGRPGLAVRGGDPLPGEGVDDHLGHVVAADAVRQVTEPLHGGAGLEAVGLGHGPAGGIPGRAVRNRDLVQIIAEERVGHHG